MARFPTGTMTESRNTLTKKFMNIACYKLLYADCALLGANVEVQRPDKLELLVVLDRPQALSRKLVVIHELGEQDARLLKREVEADASTSTHGERHVSGAVAILHPRSIPTVWIEGHRVLPDLRDFVDGVECDGVNGETWHDQLSLRRPTGLAALGLMAGGRNLCARCQFSVSVSPMKMAVLSLIPQSGWLGLIFLVKYSLNACSATSGAAVR